MTVFVDTSCWYAAADSSDAFNARAKKLLSSLRSRFTSDYVVLETWRLIQLRLGWKAAETYWEGLRSGIVTIENVTPADLEAAWNIGRSFADQEFSLTDRTSFAVMQRLGLRSAASFDSDFSIYRFGPGKRLAFEVFNA
jgi:uncharacterized protein